MFEQAFYLYLLILIPLFIAFFIWRGMARAAILRKIGEQELIETLITQISPFKRWLKALWWLIALAFVIVALARPTWGTDEEIIRTQGIQVIFAIDVSRSMEATDISPSRLARARLDIREMMGSLSGNDIGMVIFAREAFTYMPLSYDLTVAEVFLDGVHTDMLTRQGTNIPAAIERALGSFESRSPAQKVIVLITDGESHEGDAIAAAQLAVEQDAVIYTIGYGTEAGSNIPLYNSNGDFIGYHTIGESNDGTLALTALNASLLQGVADETGGFYLAGGSDLSTLIEDIERFDTDNIGEQIVTRPIERFPIFVALALLALSIEILLYETKHGGNDAV
ncbi:MAG: VWA domain-containing protein [Anaerolineae bacterium]